jgi:predicted nuclease of restriction endonuclease-like (RecB) superfamily
MVPQKTSEDVLRIIESAKYNAFRAVNREIIDMYWNIGQYVSEKVKSGVWGDGIVKELSDFIKSKNPNMSGFSPQNLRRMRQFYETYKDDAKCSPLVSELSWTNNVMIMSKDTAEAREFYIALTIKNNYSKRELERQMDSCLFERTMLSKDFSVNQLLSEKHDGVAALRDSYA